MRPTNDDKDAVSTRYNKNKNKTTVKNNVHFEPEKYEATLQSILGIISLYLFLFLPILFFNIFFRF